MCAIIDANCCTKLQTDDFADLLRAIEDGTVTVAYGGSDLLAEYRRCQDWWSLLQTLDRTRRAVMVDTDDVDDAQSRVSRQPLASDDPHIIALAQVAGARLLVSHDQALHGDFRNKSLIDNPRGSVYQNATHNHLLHRPVCRNC